MTYLRLIRTAQVKGVLTTRNYNKNDRNRKIVERSFENISPGGPALNVIKLFASVIDECL